MAKSSVSASSSPSRPILLRGKYLRRIIGIFVCINGILFISVHNLTIQSDTTNIPIQVPIFRRHRSASQNNRKQNAASGGGAIVPSPPTSAAAVAAAAVAWNNSIFEGSSYVNRYLTTTTKTAATLTRKNLWDFSTIIPAWMKEYFLWHRQQREWLFQNPEQWKSIKFYIVECSDDFNACGGTADRLGPIPFHIQMANLMRRVLFIYWTKPAPIESYLVPPRGGFDWRLPPFLVEKLFVNSNKKQMKRATFEENILKFGNNPSVIVLRVKYQSHNHGQEYYDQNRHRQQQQQQQQQQQSPPNNSSNNNNEPTYSQIYHDLWRICFTPVPEIATRIEEQMQILTLQPGKYIAVHVRALHAVETRDENLQQYWVQNSIRCAISSFSNLFPTTISAGGGIDDNKDTDKNIVDPMVPITILFVSDSTYATEAAAEYGQQIPGIRVVHREHGTNHPPLHLEKAAGDGSDGNNYGPEEYYDTFVDIYMIGMSRCTAYNMGGFGRWGSKIGYNSSCVSFLKANMEPCDLISANTGSNTNEERQRNYYVDTKYAVVQPTISKPLFIPPMLEEEDEEEEEIDKDDESKFVSVVDIFPAWNFSATLSSYHLTEILKTDPLLYETTSDNLWKHSKKIPSWMKKYFRWHHQQRSQLLNPTNWTTMRLLVMECLEGVPLPCGGTADRLKPIPTMIRFAAVTNRLLLIHWRRPAKLEEFLLPPNRGVDWRVPDWLHPFLIEGRTGTSTEEIAVMTKSDNNTVKTRYQAFDGGSGWYNGHVHDGETMFDDLFHDVWQVFFTPAPPIALRIKEFMSHHNLIPGEYVSSHIRALYAREQRSAGQTKGWARNAVNCASMLRPGYPIFVASDSKIASEYAIQYGASRNGTVVTHQNNPDPPLHLDKGEEVGNTTSDTEIVQRYRPAHYYDTFVDVYLLAFAKCIYIGKGGFGHWALLIGGNYTCTFRQKRSPQKGIENPCNWTNAPDGTRDSGKNLEKPLFFEPVHYSSTDERGAHGKSAAKEGINNLLVPSVEDSNLPYSYGQLSSYKLAEVIYDDQMLYTKADESLWANSSAIPTWMKDYFIWHREQRETLLNPQDWRSLKIFVMECLEFQDRCGGTSDRLKPTLTLLRMAAMTKRLLLIHWRRPAKLEEFLLPPKGGIDWRVPDWLHPLLMENETGSLTPQIEQMAYSANTTVRARYQSFDGGCGWYDKHLQDGEMTFNEVFHDVWRVFFTPAPPIAIRIKDFMGRHGLVPDHYASAHIRALYAIEYRSVGQTKVWTRNGVNCASTLRPGRPIFVASDSNISSAYAVEYGASKNGNVVTHQNFPNPPLHLDKGEEVTNTTSGIRRSIKYPPSAYYDTFIDVYLLAFGKCVFITKGGFGHWALLIGGNITCTMRQKPSKKGIQNPCNWTDAPDFKKKLKKPYLTEPLFLEPMEYN